MSFTLLGILNAQAAAAGGAGAYDLLETTVLTSSASSVSFTGLGSYTDYKHLQLRMTVQSTRSAGDDDFHLQFNSDTGANYDAHRLIGTGSSVISSAFTSRNQIITGAINAATGNADSFSGLVMDILDFSSTTKNTTTRLLGGQTDTSFVYLYSGLYRSTSAITSITLKANAGNLTADSRFSLYGIKGA